MERMVLLKYLKIFLETDLKIILLCHQNNYNTYKNLKYAEQCCKKF